MSLPYPVALTPCLPTELLSYVLQQTCPTTLIICGSREAFLLSLVVATSLPSVQLPIQQDPAEPESSQPPSSSESHETSISDIQPEPQAQSQPQTRHPLLRATLHQISLSRNTTTAFIPTVSHLRAYLSVLSTTSPPLQTAPVSAGLHSLQGAAAVHPLLVVYGLITLHHGTSEWSTQGLGLTCAALVEAGGRCARRVVLVEPLHERMAQQEEEGGEGATRIGNDDAERTETTDDNDNDDDDDSGSGEGGEDDEGNLERERKLRERYLQGIWHEKLPILSGSLKRAGTVGLEYGGRTVEVGMVLRRWFVFERAEWENSEHL